MNNNDVTFLPHFFHYFVLFFALPRSGSVVDQVKRNNANNNVVTVRVNSTTIQKFRVTQLYTYGVTLVGQMP